MTKRFLRCAIEKEVSDYGYTEFTDIIETPEHICIQFDTEGESNMSLIYDISAIVQDVITGCGITSFTELDLPRVRFFNDSICVYFMKKDFNVSKKEEKNIEEYWFELKNIMAYGDEVKNVEIDGDEYIQFQNSTGCVLSRYNKDKCYAEYF